MRRANNIFQQLQVFEEEIEKLENKVIELENKITEMIKLDRTHLIRVKNNEEISDEFIISGKTYQDLSPEKAWKLYQNMDYNFILVDVSAVDYEPLYRLPEAIKMPWEDFAMRSLELQSRSVPIFVISEDGVKSILACEFLVKRGFYNCSNISGGYQYWKGFQLLKKEQESA
jgi:rhodanese-related sulfurtransferase